MRLYIVRHAHAGSRSRWNGDDRLRPLSEKGRRQTAVITQLLADAGVQRLLSSPFVRCIETLRPAAAQVGVTLDSDPRLAEGAGYEGAWPLLNDVLVSGETAAVCSHGDVIPAMLRGLAADGVAFHEPLLWPKASVWVVTGEDGRWSEASYIKPPAV